MTMAQYEVFHLRRAVHYQPLDVWFNFRHQRPGAVKLNCSFLGYIRDEVIKQAIALAFREGLYCNAVGDGLPMAAWKEDDGSVSFYDPGGLRIVRPREWRWAEPEEIDDELKRSGSVMLTGFLNGLC